MTENPDDSKTGTLYLGLADNAAAKISAAPSPAARIELLICVNRELNEISISSQRQLNLLGSIDWLNSFLRPGDAVKDLVACQDDLRRVFFEPGPATLKAIEAAQAGAASAADIAVLSELQRAYERLPQSQAPQNLPIASSLQLSLPGAVIQFDETNHRCRLMGEWIDLTDRQFRVVILAALHSPQGLKAALLENLSKVKDARKVFNDLLDRDPVWSRILLNPETAEEFTKRQAIDASAEKLGYRITQLAFEDLSRQGFYSARKSGETPRLPPRLCESP